MGVIQGRGFQSGTVVVVVAVCAGWLLTACMGGGSTPLCDAAASLAQHGHLTQAAARYAAAEHAGEGDCSTAGLSSVADKQRQTFVDLAEAQAAEARGDRTTAHDRYRSVAASDVDDALAPAGVKRTAPASIAGVPASASASSRSAPGRASGDSGIGTPALAVGVGIVVAVFMVVRGRFGRRRGVTRRLGVTRRHLPNPLRLRSRPVPADSLFLSSPSAPHDSDSDTAELLQRLLDSSLRQQASLREHRASLEQQRADLYRQRQLLLRLLGERVRVARVTVDPPEQVASPLEASVVDVRFAWVPTDDTGHGRLLMIRCRPPGIRATHLAEAYQGSGERDEAEASPLQAVEEALYDAVARQPADVSWRDAELWWVGEGVLSLPRAADILAGPDGLHVRPLELLVGDPSARLLPAAAAPYPLPTLIAPMMAQVEVPTDVGVRAARTLLEVTGLVLESESGGPVAVTACTRSLAYDLMLALVKDTPRVAAVPVPRPPDVAAAGQHENGQVMAQRRPPATVTRLAQGTTRADAVLDLVFGTDPVGPDASDEAV
jgi:hypothetical protein